MSTESQTPTQPQWKEYLAELVVKMGFSDAKVEIEDEHRHARVFIYDQPPAFDKVSVPSLVEALNHIVQVIAQKTGAQPVFVDVNNYRKEREKLLTELARAAARKAVAKKEAVSLPAMNSYERRVIHVELAMHPEIKTESEGFGRERHIVVKHV